MTEIDVPDWVVDRAIDSFWRELDPEERQDPEWRKWAEEEVSAMLRAALGAWVVLGPYRFLKNGDNPSDWLDRQINGEPPNPKHLREEFRIENAYTLRQEKPK